MSKLRLIGRLVVRDLRRRPAQAALLLLAITAASATLTMGLVLHGVTRDPYAQTQAATRGPDVVALLGEGGVTFNPGPQGSGPQGSGPQGSGSQGPGSQGGKVTHSGPKRSGQPTTHGLTLSAQLLAQARVLTSARGVSAHSGPYLETGAVVGVRGLKVAVQLQGRGAATAAVDQPKVTSGTWVRPGGVVLERSFAEALGVGVGDRITLDGKTYTVAGTAVTAASTPYPNLCFTDECNTSAPGNFQLAGHGMGLGWVTPPDALVLAKADGGVSTYVLNLKLRDPASSQAFVSAYYRAHSSSLPVDLYTWQSVATGDALLVTDEQSVLSVGAWLLGLLAVASVAVLVGGRMAQRTRQVGLLKAVGATPGLVSVVLLAQNLILAVAAAGAGLLAGWLAAPLITSPGAGLVGTAGAPSLTVPIAGEVLAVAMAVALLATLVPAIRAARTSTVGALADTARSPRRGTGLMIRISALLPVPLLFGLRLVARRTRRAVLGTASIAITVMGLVAVLAFHYMASQQRFGAADGLGDPVVTRDEQMLLVITIAMGTLAVLNVVFTAWTTVLDARQATALTRALGATPRQVRAGLAAAQVLPALPGVLIGVPLGIGLFAVANGSGQTLVPPAWWLILTALGTLVAVAALTTIPARIGIRRPVSEMLGQEA